MINLNHMNSHFLKTIVRIKGFWLTAEKILSEFSDGFSDSEMFFFSDLVMTFLKVVRRSEIAYLRRYEEFKKLRVQKKIFNFQSEIRNIFQKSPKITKNHQKTWVRYMIFWYLKCLWQKFEWFFEKWFEGQLEHI